jgi:hypothetical protein
VLVSGRSSTIVLAGVWAVLDYIWATACAASATPSSQSFLQSFDSLGDV